MRNLLRAAFCAVLAFFGGTCQAQDSVTVLSGRTGQPVAGAAISVNGFAGEFITTGDGVVHLPGVPAKTRIVVNADGYLHSYVTFFVPGTVVHLIPDDDRLPYATVKNAIYDNKDNGRLSKSVAKVHTVFPDGNIRNDRVAFAALEWAVGKLNEKREQQLATPRPGSTPLPMFVIAASDSEPAEFKVVVEINPNDPIYSQKGWEDACALTFNSPDSKNVIRSSRILFCDTVEVVYFDRHTRRVFLHELTHTLGLGHLRSEDPEGVMGGNGGGTPWEFTEQEMDLLTVLTIRSANNAPVDDSTVGETTTASLKSVGDIQQPDFVEPRP